MASTRRRASPPAAGPPPKNRPPRPGRKPGPAAAGSGQTRRRWYRRGCARRRSATNGGARRCRRRVAPPGVVVDPDLVVLAGVAAHPHPEHESASRQQLEGGGLFGHLGGLPERQVHHAAPNPGPLGGGGGHGEGHHALEMRPVPEEVIGRPQRRRPEGLGLLANGREPGDRADLGAPPPPRPGPGAPVIQGGVVFWGRVGRMSPTGPSSVAGRSMSTPHGNRIGPQAGFPPSRRPGRSAPWRGRGDRPCRFPRQNGVREPADLPVSQMRGRSGGFRTGQLSRNRGDGGRGAPRPPTRW